MSPIYRVMNAFLLYHCMKNLWFGVIDFKSTVQSKHKECKVDQDIHIIINTHTFRYSNTQLLHVQVILTG